MRRIALAAALGLAFHAVPAAAATIWDGPTVDFVKTDFGAEVDVIIAGVVELTRGDSKPLYNAAVNGAYQLGVSPAGTEWAFADVNGNPSALSLALADTGGYIYDDFKTAAPELQFIGDDTFGILHILSMDIYIGVTFTQWTRNEDGGGFAYTRTTAPIPAPAAALLAPLGLAGLIALRRRA